MPMIEHVYTSSACLHDFHDYCKSQKRQDGRFKEPGQCKFCATPCRCDCHKEK